MGTKPEELFQSVNPEESPINSDGFVGVDPIYQNFANEVDNPEPKSESEAKVQDAGDGDKPAPEAKVQDAGDGDKPAPEAKTESTPKAPATTTKKS